MEENKKGIGLFALIALVISSSIGSGVFALVTDIASAASPGGAIVAWLIVGFGFLMLCLALNNLVLKRPDLEGTFVYAEEGFGKFVGFISGWGYWLSAWLGNVAFATILMSTIGFFFPVFESGQNIESIIAASLVLWALTLLVVRGVESAAFLNAIIMVCKLIPLFVFIVVAIVMFDGTIFTADFWGNISNAAAGAAGEGLGGVSDQIINCIMVMLWVFVGIEGASMLSARAKKKSDVGKATVIGLIGLLIVYILASLLPYGYLPREELANLDYPAMVYIFNDMVGSWGGAFISIGMIISILGSWLSFTILPAETSQLMAERDMLPKIFGKLNKKGAPAFSLILVAAMAQVFMFTLLFTDNAYNFAFSLCASAIVVTWALAAAYQVKYSWQNRDQKGAIVQMVIGIIALVFQIVAITLGGLQYLALCAIAYLPGIAFYAKARHDAGRKEWLTKGEIAATAVFVIISIACIFMIFNGTIAF